MTKVHLRQMIELEFEAGKNYENPYVDVKFQVSFKSPTGEIITVPGFWDGDKTWKVRFAPSAIGEWSWKSKVLNINDSGLDNKEGRFVVEQYTGSNPIYLHGFLKASDNARGFVHDDGTPFFWLGDTVWSSSSRARVEEWEEYIRFRSQQGFNIAQINVLPQHDASGTDFRVPFEEGKVVWDLTKVNPGYFQYLDKLMQITHDAGMFTAAVALWCDYVPGTNPSWNVYRKADFTPELASLYGRYIAARYAAYGTLWLISGDTDFSNRYSIAVYDAAAKSIIENTPYLPLATAHLNGGLCTNDELNTKQWLGFHMYQSSHSSKSHLSALKYGEKNRQWLPVRPVLNGEPAYENIGFYRDSGRIPRDYVRKVAWYSLLSGGNAGITYGAHGIWSWHREGETFEPASAWGMPADWKIALKFKGSADYSRLKDFFESISWMDLNPCQSIISDDSSETVCSAYDDLNTIVLYSQNLKRLKLNVKNAVDYVVKGFDPKGGISPEFDITYMGKENMVIETSEEVELVLLLQN